MKTRVGFLKKVLFVSLFAIAFAYVESAVVVYLRGLYYPQGFEFPLKVLAGRMAVIELGREAATLVMLFTAAALTAASSAETVCYFFLAFGIWDIFYYFWLFIFLGWPSSLFTWDLLFLLPVPWVSPVLAPVLVSFGFILFTLLFLVRKEKEAETVFPGIAIALILAGFSVIFSSFILDYRFILDGGVPAVFNWPVFAAGYILAAAGAVMGIINRYRLTVN